MLDRFTARVSVDSAGHFTVESDLSDAGSGIVAGVPRLVAQYLGLDETPQYMPSQAAIDDPSGALFSQGHRPSWLRAWLYRLIERLQTMGAGQLQSALARLDAASVARLLRLLAYPANFANSFINCVKAWFFPYGLDSYNPRISGSRGMFMVGRAALNAAERLKDEALAMAARALDSPTDSLEVKGAGITCRSDPARRITWAELARRAGGRLTAIGEAHLPRGWLINPANGNQIGPVDFTYASHGCDIAVRPGTGAVRILRYVACHDVGRALNPEIIRGQLLGGIAMGIGQALFEHIVTDGGKVQTTGLHDYLVPSILDLPTNVEIELLESKSGLGPDGAKGIGEAGAEAAPIAIINALYDALGAQPICIPITPEEIVNLYEQSAKGAARAQVGNRRLTEDLPCQIDSTSS
jgi:CO/xanthine dehydrogenase Mo-binding subunit